MAATDDALEKLFVKARKAIAEREWDKAKQLYVQALGLRADNPDVHYGLATVFFQSNELASAAHHFKEVTRLDPLRAGAFINLGAVQNLLQRFDDAIASLRRGLQLDSSRVEGYYNLGVVYRHMGKEDLAIQAYREALRLNPRMVDAHLNLANLFLARENHRMAVSHYEQALKLRPGWSKAMEGLRQAKAGLEVVSLSGAFPVPVAADPALQRQVDPAEHGAYLSHLHQGTVEAEESGKVLHQLLEREVEPAVKELAAALVHPHGSTTELDEYLAKFDSAVQHMRSLFQQLQNRVGHLRKSEQSFPK